MTYTEMVVTAVYDVDPFPPETDVSSTLKAICTAQELDDGRKQLPEPGKQLAHSDTHGLAVITDKR